MYPFQDDHPFSVATISCLWHSFKSNQKEGEKVCLVMWVNAKGTQVISKQQLSRQWFGSKALLTYLSGFSRIGCYLTQPAKRNSSTTFSMVCLVAIRLLLLARQSTTLGQVGRSRSIPLSHCPWYHLQDHLPIQGINRTNKKLITYCY